MFSRKNLFIIFFIRLSVLLQEFMLRNLKFSYRFGRQWSNCSGFGSFFKCFFSSLKNFRWKIFEVLSSCSKHSSSLIGADQFINTMLALELFRDSNPPRPLSLRFEISVSDLELPNFIEDLKPRHVLYVCVTKYFSLDKKELSRPRLFF